ncbi:alpha/beta hydrolase [Pigmentiphaga daeguensis]|uniref:alpha/beta hydrolase n=1 Tax=Pigmentiphaga daeguensis TaxID=414049 RepID=UPI003CD064D6
MGSRSANPPDSAIPVRIEMRDCPPIWLGVGDVDPLIGDSRLFAERLANLERPHELTVYPGMPHGFSGYAAMSAAAMREAAAFLEGIISVR